MNLVIVSPQHKEQYAIEWVEVQTTSGALVIKQGHAPIILTLVAQSDIYFLLKTGEKKLMHLIRPGFLQVDRISATALISQEFEIK